VLRCLAVQLYPINATCANLDAAIENGTALNCTAEAGYDFPFVLPPAASRAAAAEPVNLGGKSKLDALDLCCVKVRVVPTCWSVAHQPTILSPQWG
jgi:hypothetical protein